MNNVKTALSLVAVGLLSAAPLAAGIPAWQADVTHAATYAYGYTKIIGYYDTIPNDFLATYASPFRDYKEITYVGGAKWPATKSHVTDTRIPDGWVITEKGSPYNPYAYAPPSYSTLVCINGAPKGTVLWVHPTSRIPSGWAITEISDHIFPEKRSMRIVRVN
ncbi:hypothetical protein [Cohnella faecalis]|uniref:hypothetical protein n=1 Tax=Cohnella faecalis TaxID=2315694 RepID=UPI000E5B2DBA|nr:hypothetical protein [Cohnella faecalis]